MASGGSGGGHLSRETTEGLVRKQPATERRGRLGVRGRRGVVGRWRHVRRLGAGDGRGIGRGAGVGGRGRDAGDGLRQRVVVRSAGGAGWRAVLGVLPPDADDRHGPCPPRLCAARRKARLSLPLPRQTASGDSSGRCDCAPRHAVSSGSGWRVTIRPSEAPTGEDRATTRSVRASRWYVLERSRQRSRRQGSGQASGRKVASWRDDLMCTSWFSRELPVTPATTHKFPPCTFGGGTASGRKA